MDIGIVSTRFSEGDLHGDGEIVKDLVSFASTKYKLWILTSDITNPDPYDKLHVRKIENTHNNANLDEHVIRFSTYTAAELLGGPISFGLKKLASHQINMYGIKQLDKARLIYHGFFAPSLYKNIKDNNYDIIHAMTFPRISSYIAMKAAMSAHIPFVFTPSFHFNLVDQNSSYIFKKMLLNSTFVVAETDAERRELIKIGARTDQTITIPLGLNKARSNFRKFPKETIKKELGLENKFILMTHPLSSKGGNVVLKVASSLHTKFPNITVLTIGKPDKEYRKYKQYLTRHNKVEVIDLGWVENLIKWKAFSAADVFLMFSFNDAFGYSYLNAMASELPIIADKNSSASSIIENNEDGFLVNSANTREIEECVFTLFKSEEIRSAMGKSGAKKIDQIYSPKIMVERYSRVYDKTIR